MNSATQSQGLNVRDFPLSFLQWCFFVWHNLLLWQILRMLCFISVIVGFPLCLTDLLYFVLMLYSDVRTSLKHKNNSQIQNHSTQTALLFSNRSCSSQCQMARFPVLSCCNFVQMSQEKEVIFYHWPLEAMAALIQMVYIEHAELNCGSVYFFQSL